MNKKILIASLFATLMMLVPMTSAVGVSDISLNRKIEKIEDNNIITETYDNEDCGCQDVSSQYLVRLERLLNRLEIYSKIILLLPKFYPDITEESKELSNRITSLVEIKKELKPDIPSDDNTIVCAILALLFIQALIGLGFFSVLCEKYEENSILYNIFYTLLIAFGSLYILLIDLNYQFDCWEFVP